MNNLLLYATAPNRQGIKRCFCPMSVCLSRTSGQSREQRGLWRPKLAHDIPRHTWLAHHFQGQKVKGQGHQAALLCAALTRKAAAAVSVGTYIRRGKVLLRCVCSAARRRLSDHGGGEGRGQYVSPRAQLVIESTDLERVYSYNPGARRHSVTGFGHQVKSKSVWVW